MREIRCHIDEPLSVGSEVVLGDEQARHVHKVLRLTAGHPVILFNGDGHDYSADLTLVSANQVVARVQAKQTNPGESPLRITLYQALLKSDKMEWVLQKATELGVHAVVPVVSEFSDVKIKPERWPQKEQRWKRIIVSACTQSERAFIPHLRPPQTLEQIDLDGALSLVLHPHPQDGSLFARQSMAEPPKHINVLVGPEGGFSDQDIRTLTNKGARCIRLGPRIMRAETAPIAILAVLQQLCGDFRR